MNEVADAYRAFIEGLLGPDKTAMLDRKLESWRFLDFWRYGILHKNHIADLERQLELEKRKTSEQRKFIETLMEPINRGQ